jgi:hypothetical protein
MMSFMDSRLRGSDNRASLSFSNAFIGNPSTNDVNSAIIREKQLKKWNKDWKVRLIEEKDPEWRDLYDEFYGLPPARE